MVESTFTQCFESQPITRGAVVVVETLENHIDITERDAIPNANGST